MWSVEVRGKSEFLRPYRIGRMKILIERVRMYVTSILHGCNTCICESFGTSEQFGVQSVFCKQYEHTINLAVIWSRPDRNASCLSWGFTVPHSSRKLSLIGAKENFDCRKQQNTEICKQHAIQQLALGQDCASRTVEAEKKKVSSISLMPRKFSRFQASAVLQTPMLFLEKRVQQPMIRNDCLISRTVVQCVS